MASTEVSKVESAIVDWDFDIEVIETKAVWDRWQGIAVTWRSATVELARRLWRAHKVLGGDHEAGRKKNATVGTISGFIDGVGIPRRTFYRFVERIDTMIQEGVEFEELPGDLKLVEVAAQKSEREVEMGVEIARLSEEIDARQRSIDKNKAQMKVEKGRLKESHEEIAALKGRLEKAESEDRPAKAPSKSKTALEDLEKKHAELSKEVSIMVAAVDFKKELKVLLRTLDTVENRAGDLLESMENV